LSFAFEPDSAWIMANGAARWRTSFASHWTRQPHEKFLRASFDNGLIGR